MYAFNWDKNTGGYLLTTQTGKFVANEIRPVFARELSLTGLGNRFEYNSNETGPLLWAQKNIYLLNGEKIAQMNKTQYGKPLSIEYFFEGKLKLTPVDIGTMVKNNTEIMDIVVADAKRRTKELFDKDIERCDIAYIAFSGGKDSVALLDICHHVLPLSMPVIFSDTDMELPDTYDAWDDIQPRYPERKFIRASAETSALKNWRQFGPPSRTIRWCCSIHKSTPALMALKEKLNKPSIKAMAFVGVRGDESYSRSFYEDSTDGAKNASQLNRMPILDWGAHELWLYIFANDLLINSAYHKGFSRVGCLMCPESSGKYEWYVDKAYPQLLKPYNDIIIGTSSKNFKTTKDKAEFIGNLSWQARKSGSVLRETISNPQEDSSGLKTTFQSPHFSEYLFYEWIKTLGTVINERESGRQHLKLPQTLDGGILFDYNSPYAGGGTITFEFRDKDEQFATLPLLRSLLRKVSACVACRSCEANCTVGAISVKSGKIKIDGSICTKCRKCYNIDYACWRFKSMYKTDTEQRKMSGINNYNNFGLREKGKYLWISTLVELDEQFFPWHDNHPLGNKMVPSARVWFRQALLIHETRKPTKLVALFRKHSGSYSVGWEFIWIALVNNAALMKWFVTVANIDETYTVKRLAEMLTESNPSLRASSINGGLAALKDMLTKSPLGGEGTVTLPTMKGSTVTSITRKGKEVNQLTILYGIYLIAHMAERSSFTVREMLTADVESIFVSPLVAFGIMPDTFKKQCEGLRSKYPDYISTTFTHGNDGFEVFPNKYSLEDIINLALEE